MPNQAQGSLLLTWFNLNPRLIWISYIMRYMVWGEINYPFQNFNGCTVEVSEWISNFIPLFTIDVITYPGWD